MSHKHWNKEDLYIYIIISIYNINKHQSWILLDVVSTHFLDCWNNGVLDILKNVFVLSEFGMWQFFNQWTCIIKNLLFCCRKPKIIPKQDLKIINFPQLKNIILFTLLILDIYGKNFRKWLIFRVELACKYALGLVCISAVESSSKNANNDRWPWIIE